MSSTLETIIVEPRSGAATHTVIWLHGLGADGHDFANLLPALSLPLDHTIRFIFPHAPMRAITINQGMRMRGWYDIYDLNDRSKQDVQGILNSTTHIEQLIAAENDQGIPTQNIVIAGFSQGGAIALHLALHHSPLAGIMALSTYIPLREGINANVKPKHSSTPLLICHGDRDEIVPLIGGETARDTFTAMGFPVEWHSYPMAHEVCLSEIEDIKHWLLARCSHESR